MRVPLCHCDMKYSINKDVFRSLLQKSIRRGNKDLAVAVAYKLAELNDSQWVINRIGTIVFEECWQQSNLLVTNSSSPIEIIKSISVSIKQKDAAGLGTLGYYLSQNDFSTLDFSPDYKALKIVAAGVKRPTDFFNWAIANSNIKNRPVIHKIQRYYSLASWPWDKAFAIASIYLHVLDEYNSTQITKETKTPYFPYWVAVDKHTREGKYVLQDFAKKHNLDSDLLKLASFYFEGAEVNILSPSLWWEQEIQWNCKKFNTSKSELEDLWNNVRDQIKENLNSTSSKLSEIFDNFSESSERAILSPTSRCT